MPTRRDILLAAAASASLHTGMSFAQAAWPEKPIRLVVPFPAGGGVDFVARTLALRLGEVFKQQVIVDNRSGASGAIGADAVAKAEPDGYTLLMASPAEVLVGPIAGQKTPYTPETDFIPVALAGETPLIIVAHPSLAAKNLPELLAYAKANPNRLSYGTPGNGSSMHFAGKSLEAGGGVSMMHVPYRGAAPAINDALGNQVGLAIVGMPPTVAHIKAGKLRALAVTTTQRSSVFPDVPAVAELPGMSNYRFTNWMGVFAPARTPQATVDRLSTVISQIVKEPAMREKLTEAGVDPVGMQRDAFAAFLASERAQYTAIAKSASIRFGD
jgi:tripartite-type tricarboxylate transporter receptor subunit TctC